MVNGLEVHMLMNFKLQCGLGTYSVINFVSVSKDTVSVDATSWWALLWVGVQSWPGSDMSPVICITLDSSDFINMVTTATRQQAMEFERTGPERLSLASRARMARIDDSSERHLA